MGAGDDPSHDDDGNVVGWEGVPSVGVATSQVDEAYAAMAAAGWRWSHITERGVELSTEQLDSTAEYTPNFIFQAELVGDLLVMSADCQGWYSRAMMKRMIDVVAEELERLEVNAVVAPFTE
jgi:hypothetical protein